MWFRSSFEKTKYWVGEWLKKTGNFVKSFAPWTATLGVMARWAGALSTILGVPVPWLVWAGKLTTLIWWTALGLWQVLTRAWDKVS